MPNVVPVKKHETSGNPDQVSAKKQAGKEADTGANRRRGIAAIDICSMGVTAAVSTATVVHTLRIHNSTAQTKEDGRHVTKGQLLPKPKAKVNKTKPYCGVGLFERKTKNVIGVATVFEERTGSGGAGSNAYRMTDNGSK